jgi:hypothetical protein
LYSNILIAIADAEKHFQHGVGYCISVLSYRADTITPLTDEDRAEIDRQIAAK